MKTTKVLFIALAVLIALAVVSSAGVVTAKQTPNHRLQETASGAIMIQSANLGEVIDNHTTPYYIVKLVATLFAPEVMPLLDVLGQVYQVDYGVAPHYSIDVT